MKINVNDYDYVVYVDASGDDGMKFDKCSSLCFTTACFISAVADIPENMSILNKIKEISGRKTADELKHSRLRRHRAYNSALKELENLKGMVAIHNSFKQEMYTGTSSATKELLDDKELIAFTHTFPIETILNLKELFGKNILVCIDRMKQTDMNTVEQILNLHDHETNIKITFRDSKDPNFELIQIADVLSGLFRCFFEETITVPEIKNFLKICRICHTSIQTKKFKRSCTVNKVYAIRRRIMGKIQNVSNLLINNDGSVILYGLSMFPPAMSSWYHFIDCTKK